MGQFLNVDFSLFYKKTCLSLWLRLAVGRRDLGQVAPH
jgi:hypothetical protein